MRRNSIFDPNRRSDGPTHGHAKPWPWHTRKRDFCPELKMLPLFATPWALLAARRRAGVDGALRPPAQLPARLRLQPDALARRRRVASHRHDGAPAADAASLLPRGPRPAPSSSWPRPIHASKSARAPSRWSSCSTIRSRCRPAAPIRLGPTDSPLSGASCRAARMPRFGTFSPVRRRRCSASSRTGSCRLAACRADDVAGSPGRLWPWRASSAARSRGCSSSPITPPPRSRRRADSSGGRSARPGPTSPS